MPLTDITFPRDFIDALLKGNIQKDAALLKRYFELTGKSSSNSTYLNHMAKQLHQITVAVRSVNDFCRERELQIAALTLALNLFESVSGQTHRDVTPAGCAFYACAYVAVDADPSIIPVDFYNTHVTQRNRHTTKEYMLLSSLLPVEKTDIYQRIDAKLDAWQASGLLTPAMVESLKARARELIKEFKLPVQRFHPLAAAVIIYYLKIERRLDFTDTFITDEFGVSLHGLYLKAEPLGIVRGRLRRRRERR